MSGTNSSRNKALIAGALGAVVLLGGAGVFLYSQLEQKRKLDNLERQLARLDISLSKLYQEILSLRSHLSGSKKSVNSSSKSRSSVSISSNDAETDSYFSVLNSEEENDDFEDCLPDVETSESKNFEEKLFEKVDGLMKGNDEERLEAFNILEKHKNQLAENVDFLWRFAKAHQIRAAACGAQKNLDGKKKHVFEGLEYATKALSLVDTNADVHKWFAILTGMQTDFVSVKQKVQNGYLFQKHVLIAIKIKPNDYSLHHLLGRFKFEVANTSWIQKKMAASLFAEIPDVTYKDAITDLLEAEKLNTTPWKENRLLIAKCYINNGDYSSGIDWLDSAKKVIPKTEEDVASDREINLLLEKYKNYNK